MSAITPPSEPAVKTPYEDLLREILADGTPKADRTGTGTRSLFARQIRYDLSEGCLLYTSPSPRDRQKSRMPSSA